MIRLSSSLGSVYDLQSVDYPDGIDTAFSIIETLIHCFNGRSLENPHRVLKRDSMQGQISATLFSIPTVVHIMYLHNVNIEAIQATQF